MGGTLRTPYQILEIAQDADVKEVRNAFRNHVQALRRGELSDTTFRNICRAFECLSDYEKRKNYDENKTWISKLSVASYTLQQLASEYILISDLMHRLENATLREINAQDPVTGHTALYCAARVGNFPAVLYLIEKGAEPDLSQRTQSTALHVSAFYGHPEIVRCLLESGADHRIKNAFKNTAEAEAYDGNVKQTFVELKQTPFVKAAANQLRWFKNNIHHLHRHIDEQYYIHRQTLLHCASKKGYLPLVRWLVEERSANLDIVDINLNSALHLAAYGGHASVVEYLLDQGANSLLINKWNMTAEQEGKHYGINIREIFQRMRQRNMLEMAMNGVDWWFQYHFGSKSPDTIDTGGTSLLYMACRYGQTSVAKWLLEHGANVNIQLQKDSKSTPLHGAAFHGHVSIVELLLAHGADVNIKNNYGATVFDEQTPATIKIILEQYRRNLRDDKLMPVYVYTDKLNGNDKDEPIVKTHLRYDAKQNDLMEALPATLRNQNGYFAIAKRPLWFETDDTTVLTAVCSARYVRSIFVEIPLRLTFSTGNPEVNENDRSKIDFSSDYSTLEKTFEKQMRSLTIDLKPSLSIEQTYHIGDLSFLFAAGSNNKDVSINIKYINLSNSRYDNLPGCLCLFKITYETRPRLKEPPIVSFQKEPNVRLYTLASPTPYWFAYDTRQKRLPMVEGIHAFFYQVDVIPALLSLPADMFIAMTIEQPLVSRDHPISCKYLELRKRNVTSFPLIAYHGTRIDVVHSILMDGLVVPGTLVASGARVTPPANHFPLYANIYDISNFASAIFVSPSIYYSSDPVYSTSFEYEGKRLLTVLECSIKTGSYTTHKSTVPNYIAHPTDDINAIEWRINDPNSIEITGILFIIKEFHQRKKT
jgi:ankyrin repeat protein